MVGLLFIVYLLNYFIDSTKLVNTKFQFDINQNIYTKRITKDSVFESTNTNEYLIKDYNFQKDKKIISVSPGGYKGFYMMGIVSFIKKNYNLENFVFSGASAGAWNSLFLSYNKDPNLFINELMNIDYQNSKCLNDIQFLLKYKILDHFSDEDFNLSKLFIGVSSLDQMEIKTNIYNDFDNLEDAIDCCVASSNIPFITGKLNNKYHNKYSFDGGFGKYPYINFSEPILHISPNMWSTYLYDKNYNLFDFSDLIMRKNINILKLFEDGYNDAKKYKHILDNKLIL